MICDLSNTAVYLEAKPKKKQQQRMNKINIKTKQKITR